MKSVHEDRKTAKANKPKKKRLAPAARVEEEDCLSQTKEGILLVPTHQLQAIQVSSSCPPSCSFACCPTVDSECAAVISSIVLELLATGTAL
jgi:hypothetical protein